MHMGREELRKSLRLKRARGRGFGINGSGILDTEDIALVNWCEDKNVKVGVGGDGEESRGFDGHGSIPQSAIHALVRVQMAPAYDVRQLISSSSSAMIRHEIY